MQEGRGPECESPVKELVGNELSIDWLTYGKYVCR